MAETPSSAPTGISPGTTLEPRDPLAWIQERWVLVAGLALLLLVVWFASSEPHRENENGRYVLVKDDVPCQSVEDREGDGRRWCYLLLDTQSGDLEERLRKFRPRERR